MGVVERALPQTPVQRFFDLLVHFMRVSHPVGEAGWDVLFWKRVSCDARYFPFQTRVQSLLIDAGLILHV